MKTSKTWNRSNGLRKAGFALLFSMFSVLSFAQTIISPIGSFANAGMQKAQSSVDIFLPFIDDFSNYIGIPNPDKWETFGVVVNSSYQFNPPSVGVATLDATDIYGKLYTHATSSPFYADTLASRFIRLDSVRTPYGIALSPSDSVYLSFYVQPAGGSGKQWEAVGARPSAEDSIILEFYSPETGWNWIWAMGGEHVDSLYNRYGSYYKYVLIPITDPVYFSKEFRFRFRNIASLSNSSQSSYIGNCDQWNIDYVYLNRNRSFEDSSRRDLAFVEPAPSMLKRYQAMPSRQFRQEEMADSLHIKIVNLADIALSSTYKYEISNESGMRLYSYDGGFENISPYSQTQRYQTSPNHASPAVDFVFDINPMRWYAFDITHTIKEGVGQDWLPANDTIRFKQIFEDFFAYDDGTAENGIGVEPISGSHLAVRYDLNEKDTLTAVDIYFNTSLNESNFKPFFICVWTCENALPGEMIYKSEKLIPRSDSLNRFTRFVLDESIVLPSAPFFISLQTKGNDYLNIGFDRNTNSSEYTFSKTSSDWQQSFEKGSVMMRPYFGYRASVGLKDVDGSYIKIYPNPASTRVYLQNCNGLLKRLFDANGRLLVQTRENEIDISRFDCGVYILQVADEGSLIHHEKIIKAR